MFRISLILFASGLLCMPASSADDLAGLKTYQYGADQSPLLAVERQVEASMESPAAQREMAGRLLDVLLDPQATLAARQFAAIQLRMCGTEAEVLSLASLLGKGMAGQFAREALERIPGQAAGKALRDALSILDGPALVSVIHSVANRRDRQSVGALIKLTGVADAKVAAAAAHALGRIGGRQAAARLKELAAGATDLAAAQAYLSCATIAVDAGDRAAAALIFASLADRKYPAAVRRAALTGQLMLAEDPQALLAAWLAGADADACHVAQRHLEQQTTGWLVASCKTKPTDKAIYPAETLAARGEKTAIPILIEAARQKDSPTLRQRGLMAMSGAADRDCVALLLDALADETPIARAASTVLAVLPSTAVDAPLIATLKASKGQKQARLIDVLVARRTTAAISPLLELAGTAEDDDAGNPIYSAMVALGDEKTLSAMVAVLPNVKDGQQRDRLEMACRDIAWKCGNNVEPILAAMKHDSNAAALLPLLGRVGGDAARRKIDEALASTKDDLKAAGFRALCNWPDDSVAERLGQLAEQAGEPGARVSALRAYIRVVSIESQRPATDTLAMLQKAYNMAQRVEEKRLAVERAKMARHVRTLRWLGELLDDDAVREAACSSIVELAHHRQLRNPNREEFAGALKKVIAISKNGDTVRRAKGYLEGV